MMIQHKYLKYFNQYVFYTVTYSENCKIRNQFEIIDTIIVNIWVFWFAYKSGNPDKKKP